MPIGKTGSRKDLAATRTDGPNSKINGGYFQMTTTELLMLMGVSWVCVIAGGVTLYGVKEKWRWLIEPRGKPEDSLMTWIFGKRFRKRFMYYNAYVMGATFFLGGIIGLVRNILLLGEKLGYW